MKRIIIIDDNPSARKFASASLKHLGHELVEVEPNCLISVLNQLHEQPPDLLVLDLLMPGCPGLSVLRFCREDEHLRNLKVLILTSHGSATIAQVLQHFGNAHYLAKPVAPMALANCVERFMEGTLKVDPGWDLSCRGTVAVVDDSRLSRAFHCSCMRKHGFRAVEVEPTDLVSTRRAIEDLNPDLVLLDYLMPTFNGEQLLRTMRTVKALRDTPVLIITAHKNLLAETQMDDLSGIDVMFKPVHAEELLQGVEAILGLP